MNVSEKILDFKKNLPEKCTLVAVSKTKPSSLILDAYQSGHRDFGENKAQELTSKFDELPKDIRWHMIGHMQRNKVKYIAPFVHLIHGVDSFKLLKEIQKQAEKVDRVIDCLLQVHIAQEETKFGLDEVEVMEILTGSDLADLKNIRIKGLMGMATNTSDEAKVLREFEGLRNLFDKLRASDLPPNAQMETLSMGMS
ncbi:MAG: YggS family pyridoxal phosphate-dependent enzyme, partial [Cyclobacteriaceae bacterium]